MTSQNFVIDLSGGWKMFACGDGIAVHDAKDNHVLTIEGISLEKAAQVFNLGWQVGHISTTVNLKGKLVGTITRPPLALDPDESLPLSVAESDCPQLLNSLNGEQKEMLLLYLKELLLEDDSVVYLEVQNLSAYLLCAIANEQRILGANPP